MRHLVVKFGKIHFITKYFNARWGFLVRVLLYNKPYFVEKINKLEEFYDNLAIDTALYGEFFPIFKL